MSVAVRWPAVALAVALVGCTTAEPNQPRSPLPAYAYVDCVGRHAALALRRDGGEAQVAMVVERAVGLCEAELDIYARTLGSSPPSDAVKDRIRTVTRERLTRYFQEGYMF